MILGIKVGPQKQSIADLSATNPPFAEVWFNICKKNDFYPELFTELKRRSMQAGLHFWGHLADGTWTNIGHQDRDLVNESMRLIKETIDIAARNNFLYVNIHPANRVKCRIDFDRHIVTPYTDPIPEDVSRAIFIENAIKLHEYAHRRGVIFTVETAPSRETDNWIDTKNRSSYKEIYTLGNTVLVELAHMGVAIANDFGHTGCAIISHDRSNIADYVIKLTNTLAPQTRLVHIGYIVPPYNGTDFHDHLDNPLFDTDQAVPNKNEMKKLFHIFLNRNDVWALCEPVSNHPKNYRLAKELLSSVGS